MWRQLKSIEDVNNEEIVEYLRQNPISMIVDLEDEEYEDFKVVHFAVFNAHSQDGPTMVLECDSALIDPK